MTVVLGLHSGHVFTEGEICFHILSCDNSWPWVLLFPIVLIQAILYGWTWPAFQNLGVSDG